MENAIIKIIESKTMILFWCKRDIQMISGQYKQLFFYLTKKMFCLFKQTGYVMRFAHDICPTQISTNVEICVGIII